MQLSTEQGRNPLVLATFSSTAPSSSSKPRQRLLFYAHYDVQPAAEEPWETNPWELSGRNGYLYGRGVSDNKGPILAVACAASSLRARRELDVDVVLVVEGEEEAGSRGFASCIRRHKVCLLLSCYFPHHAYSLCFVYDANVSRTRSATSTPSSSPTRPGSTKTTRVSYTVCAASSMPT